jgi:outer membrane receptor protein involved in Fe transport
MRIKKLNALVTLCSAAMVSSMAHAALEEIVVTANKRSESANDVGMAISAVSGEMLAEQKLTSLEDIASTVPGLVFSPSTTNTPIFTLRGVGFNESSLGVYPAASLYIDEAPLPFPVMASHSAYDLERVEVLKGPQGTLFGQNSTAGAINFIAARPTDTFSAGGDISYSRFNKKEINGFVSGPLAENLLGRVAFTGVKADEWQKSYTRDDENGKEDYYAGRLLLEYEPSDAVRLKMNLNGWKDKSDPQAQQLIGFHPTVPSAFADPNTNAQAQLTTPFSPEDPRAADWTPESAPKGDRTFYQLVLRGDFDLNEDLTLTVMTSYADFEQDQVTDGDGSDLILFDLRKSEGELDTWNTEIRLANSPDNEFRWVAGVNYEKSNTFEDQVLYFEDNTNNSAQNLFINNDSNVLIDQEIENYAVFFSTETDIAEDITLRAGIRYTDSSIDAEVCPYAAGELRTANLFNFLGNLPAPNPFNPNNLPFDPVGGLPDCYAFNNQGIPGEPFIDSLEEDNVSWRVGADFHLSEDSLLYVNISEGYKTGSYPALAAANHTALEPVVAESVLAYELGIKSTLAGGSVQLNAAVFYNDYTDKQLRGKYPDPSFGILDTLVNVPESKIAGIEADIIYQITDSLTISAAVTYLDSEITEYEGTNLLGDTNDFSGDRMPFTPELTYNLDIDYRIPLNSGGELFMGVRATGQTDSDAAIGADRIVWPTGPYSRAVDSHPYELDGFTTIDARLGYETEDGKWRVMLWGKNITDEYYWTTIIPSSDDIARFAGRPATYGITVGYTY